MTGRPELSEAASYYFTYIDKTEGEDPSELIAMQYDRALGFFSRFDEEKSLGRYAPGKWSAREVLSHVNDGERLFAFRAFWFARGFTAPLASFDQNVAVAASGADALSWKEHVEEFARVRQATISLFRHMPHDAWMRGGIASENFFTVRALAFIVAGHLTHHMEILRRHYL